MVGRSKAVIRSDLLRGRQARSEELRAASAIQVQERFLALDGFRTGRTLALYAPIRGEVATDLIFGRARAVGKRVAFPVARTEERRLEFFVVEALADLEPGTFGILEPRESDETKLEPGLIDLIAVPGVAFDRRGHRLGYGGGYYDRLLSQSATRPRCVVGLAFDSQILDEVPSDGGDSPMDWIVTESWLYPNELCASDGLRSQGSTFEEV